MRRLISVFAGRTCNFVGNIVYRLTCDEVCFSLHEFVQIVLNRNKHILTTKKIIYCKQLCIFVQNNKLNDRSAANSWSIFSFGTYQTPGLSPCSPQKLNSNITWGKQKYSCSKRRLLKAKQRRSWSSCASVVWSGRTLFEPEREKTYLLICAPNEDSNQPAHPRSLLCPRCPHEEILHPCLSKNRSLKIQIRLHEAMGMTKDGMK